VAKQMVLTLLRHRAKHIKKKTNENKNIPPPPPPENTNVIIPEICYHVDGTWEIFGIPAELKRKTRDIETVLNMFFASGIKEVNLRLP
jgi:hypothetical protein